MPKTRKWVSTPQRSADCTPVLFIPRHSRVHSVCFYSSIVSRRVPWQILFYNFSPPISMAEAIQQRPIPSSIALRSLSHNCILSLTPTFGWLLCPSIQQKPSKLKAPPLSLFLFFLTLNSPPKTTSKLPSYAFRLIASPLQHTPCHRHHRSVDCWVSLSSGGHPRPVLRPSLIFLMSAIGASPSNYCMIAIQIQ